MTLENSEPSANSIYLSMGGAKKEEYLSGLSGKAAVVHAELERRLTAGVYKFGETLPTADIIREFGISRAPLTAALNQLRSAGYIEIIPQVGSRVIEPTDRQVRDFYVMFSLVEQGMARFAAERCTANEAAFISEVCQRLRGVSSTSRGAKDEYAGLLELYHSAIHQAAKSPFEVMRVRSYLRIAGFFLSNGKPSQHFSEVVRISNQNRPAVTAAIVAGDAAGAEAAMANYILASINFEV